MKKKIMVVDDEKTLLEFVRIRLEKSGFDVIDVADGQQAIDKARTERPDLIILDLLMPKMDGTEVSRALKQDPLTKDIPVIFLTALKKKSEETSVTKGAPNTVLAKPFETAAFLEEIQALLK